MNFVQEHLVGRLDFRTFLLAEGVVFRNGKFVCPFHDDQTSSFSIDADRLLWKCHADGCEGNGGGDVVTFLAKRLRTDSRGAIAEFRRRGYGLSNGNGHETKAAPPKASVGGRKRWEIRNRGRELIAIHERRDLPDGRKEFSWERNGKPTLGGLPAASLPLYGAERLAAKPTGPVILCEGEKACDALLEHEFLAVATVTGAAAIPSAEVLGELHGWDVVLWPDHDKPGEKHMARIAEALNGVAGSVRILHWGEKERDDAADYFGRGGTAEQLDLLLADAREWSQAPNEAVVESPTRPRLTVSWDDYMAETYPPVPSLWGPAFLVKGGGYLIVSGDTGVGKTILIVNLILSLAEGRDEFLGFPLPGRPVRQLLLEAEGSRQLFKDRVAQIARNRGIRGSLPIAFHALGAELSIDRLWQMAEESKAEHALLDPVGRFHAGNENDTTEWRKYVTTPLAKISTGLALAESFADHYAKPNENRAGQHKTRGSAAKVQDCGAAMRLEYGKAGGSSRILYFDRVRDSALPFPDRDPSRMPLLMDLATGTIKVDEREDADLGVSPEPRLADVVRLLKRLAPDGGKTTTASLRLAIQSSLELEKSRAYDLIKSAKNAKLIQSAGRGYYQLPGGLLEFPSTEGDAS